MKIIKMVVTKLFVAVVCVSALLAAVSFCAILVNMGNMGICSFSVPDFMDSWHCRHRIFSDEQMSGLLLLLMTGFGGFAMPLLGLGMFLGLTGQGPFSHHR
ncbi:MAG: hypothetical protein WAZ27_01205 [Minisyncoccia bacterium]